MGGEASMRNQALSPVELVAIYEGKRNSHNRVKIKEKLNAVLAGKATYIYPHYKKAAEIIRATRQETPSKEAVGHTEIHTLQAATNDPYEKLAQGQQMINEAIVEIAELEASKRADTKISALKEHYEKELQRYQAIIAKMQDSSAVGMLRRHFGNS